MISPALPDLDALDREALKALVMAQHSELLDQRKSNAEEIERLKLIIEKYRADDLRQEEREAHGAARTA